jgi:C-terminal processing protease CtpA/Prc
MNSGWRFSSLIVAAFSAAIIPLFFLGFKNSPAEACGLQVGDLVIAIDNVEAYRYTLQSINNLLKSEEGKWLYFEVERNGKTLKFKFQLKSIL